MPRVGLQRPEKGITVGNFARGGPGAFRRRVYCVALARPLSLPDELVGRALRRQGRRGAERGGLFV